MSTQPFDAARYKDAQHGVWDNAAAGWRVWWQSIEQATGQANERLMHLAQVRPGQRILDIATGIGEPALSAARRVGPTGRVVATDLSPQMLTVAQERAAALGLTNVDFRPADAEELDYPEGSFDVVLCRFGLMFLPNLSTALRTIRHMLVPQGRFVAAIWDVPLNGFPSESAMRIAQDMFRLPPSPPGAPSTYGLANGVLEQAMRDTGFRDVHAEALPVTLEWQSTEACQQCMRDIVPHLASLVGQQPPARQTEFWRAHAAAVQNRVTPDGRIRFTNTAICVAGQR